MTDEPVAPKSLGTPSIDHCKAVYRSMLKPTVRGFQAKIEGEGYVLPRATAQRFIQKHIKGITPKPKEKVRIAVAVGDLHDLDVPALEARLYKERLIYTIMLLESSQHKTDLLAVMPQNSSALVKSMTDSAKGVPVPTVAPDEAQQHGNGHDVAPTSEVSNAISLFLKKEGKAA